MNHNNKTSRQCIWAILLMAITITASAAPLNILEFKKNQLTTVEQTQICTLLKSFCDQTERLRSLKAPDHKLWLLKNDRIATAVPQISQEEPQLRFFLFSPFFIRHKE